MSNDNIEATDAEVDAIGEILYAAGWRDRADALGDGLRAAIPKLREALVKHGAAPVPAAVPSTIEETIRTATQYAHNLVVSLHRDHYQDNRSFEPFDDLIGLLSQIDNMICGWKEPAAVPDDEPEWPAYHHEGMGCGIEDRGITDRYEACRYGFEDAVERCSIAFDNWRATSSVPAAVPYGVVLPDHEPTIAIGEILDGYDGEELDNVWESIKAYADVHARSALKAAGIPALNEAPSLWVSFSDNGANIRMWSAEGPKKITDAGLTPIQFVLAAAQKKEE